MVFLLNYLPVFILIVGGLITFSFIRKGKAAVAGVSFVVSVALAMGYSAFAPSYMPKGTVHKTALPAFEESDATVENRLRVARTEEEHDKRLDDGLDWKDKVEQGKQEAAAEPESE